MKKLRWLSASEMFVTAGVSAIEALVRSLMYKFIWRLNTSENEIVGSMDMRFETTYVIHLR